MLSTSPVLLWSARVVLVGFGIVTALVALIAHRDHLASALPWLLLALLLALPVLVHGIERWRKTGAEQP